VWNFECMHVHCRKVYKRVAFRSDRCCKCENVSVCADDTVNALCIALYGCKYDFTHVCPCMRGEGWRVNLQMAPRARWISTTGWVTDDRNSSHVGSGTDFCWCWPPPCSLCMPGKLALFKRGNGRSYALQHRTAVTPARERRATSPLQTQLPHRAVSHPCTFFCLCLSSKPCLSTCVCGHLHVPQADGPPVAQLARPRAKLVSAIAMAVWGGTGQAAMTCKYVNGGTQHIVPTPSCVCRKPKAVQSVQNITEYGVSVTQVSTGIRECPGG